MRPSQARVCRYPTGTRGEPHAVTGWTYGEDMKFIPLLFYFLLQGCVSAEPLAVYWCRQTCDFGHGAETTYSTYVAALCEDDAVDQMVELGEWKSPAACVAQCKEAQ